MTSIEKELPNTRAAYRRRHLAQPDDPDLIRKLVDVAIRLHHRFSPNATFMDVLTVVGQCRRDLDIASSASLPELVERLAAQRLLDTRPVAVLSDQSVRPATAPCGALG